jgi:hypothetical protein
MRRAVPLLPELDMQLPGALAEPRRVPVRERSRNRDQHRAVQQSFAVVSLDRLAAVVTRLPRSAADRIAPPRSQAAAEVAPHEHMFAWVSTVYIDARPTTPLESRSCAGSRFASPCC